MVASVQFKAVAIASSYSQAEEILDILEQRKISGALKPIGVSRFEISVDGAAADQLQALSNACGIIFSQANEKDSLRR